MAHPIYWFKVLAWTTPSVCAGISARSAVVFAKHRSRAYSILLLFALIWAILLPFYSEQKPQDLILGFTGFLLGQIARLVSDETGVFPGSLRNQIDTWAPLLFIGMVAPSILNAWSISLPTDPWWLPTPGITTIVSLCGYYAIYDAFRDYSTNTVAKRRLLYILWSYTIVETAFTVWRYCIRHFLETRSGLWEVFQVKRCEASAAGNFRTPYCGEIYPFWLILFMILKSALTVVFIWLILKPEVLKVKPKALSTIWERLLFLIHEFDLTERHVPKLEELAESVADRQDAISLLEEMAARHSEKAKDALKRLAAKGIEEAKAALQRLEKSKRHGASAP